MTVDFLLPGLAFMTLGAIIVFALVSKYRTKKRKDDPRDPGSTLSRNTPDPAFQPDAKQTRKDLHPDRDTPINSRNRKL